MEQRALRHAGAAVIVAIGVDGCRSGWVFVLLEDGRFRGAELQESFADGLAVHPEAAAIGMDIPIGMPGKQPRRADVQARHLLGRRASTVFITPPRAVLSAASYAEANEISRRAAGRGMSRQAYALLPKIREVDAVSDARVHEVHPEVSFARLGSRPLGARKQSWAGMAERRSLLAAAGIHIPDDLGEVGLAAAPDDVLDAAAAAWSAARIAAGSAVPLPDPPEMIGGHKAAIWS